MGDRAYLPSLAGLPGCAIISPARMASSRKVSREMPSNAKQRAQAPGSHELAPVGGSCCLLVAGRLAAIRAYTARAHGSGRWETDRADSSRTTRRQTPLRSPPSSILPDLQGRSASNILLLGMTSAEH